MNTYTVKAKLNNEVQEREVVEAGNEEQALELFNKQHIGRWTFEEWAELQFEITTN